MVDASRLPPVVPEAGNPDLDSQSSYNGDRILVNKYVYTFSEPQRWDVVVFKFPGDAKINYIKRLVGLPGEKLRIYQGDLFVGDKDASQPGDFKIERKPADKVLAMRQLVHDTDYDPAELAAADWPLRWENTGDSGTNGWKVESAAEGIKERQNYRIDATGDHVSWLRYHHYVPNYEVWQQIARGGKLPAGMQPSPRLITDANPYNAYEDRRHWDLPYPYRQVSDRSTLEIDGLRQGLHWVGDLMLEADVKVEEARGELLLDLVEGGQHFRCSIDLETGEATLTAGKDESYKPSAKTPIRSAGEHRVAFANVDDQLLLWVDGDLISFDGGTEYDVAKVFGDRSGIIPQTSDEDPGDLAPAGIGARGANVEVSRLQLWRDIYYIADDSRKNASGDPVISDFDHPLDYSMLMRMQSDPALWDHFSERKAVEFPLGIDQFFVMGDNSAASSDARLWNVTGRDGGRPGGQYLERRLLIGKALAVYWPHSWNRVPGTPIPFPLFPNFGDMRLVR
jgi:signal peptidase I